MAEIGSAFLSIMPSAKGFGSKFDSEVGGEVEGAGKRAGSRFGAAMKVGLGAAVAGGALLAKFMGDALGEARDAQVVGARTESVIKSMGGAANVTAKQVGDLAAAISNKTAVDDEAIQEGQNLLLTFGNLRNEVGKGNDIFSQSSQLMTDMSVAMGQSMKSSAIQLGKALNDPTKGVTALSRVGVSFTEQQKEQIKTLQESGNILGAQKVILGELEKQFGGAAASMSTPAERAKVAWGNFQEQIGTAVLPTVDRLLNFFTTRAIPAVSAFASAMSGRIGPATQFLAGNFRTIASVLGVVVAGMAVFKIASLAAAAATAIQAAGTSAATGATWSLNAALRANPIGIVVTLLTALAAGMVIAYQKSSTFRGIVNAVGGALGDAIGWLGRGVGAVVGFGASVIRGAGQVGEFASSVKSRVGDAIGFISDIPDRAADALGNLGSTLYNAGAELIQGLIDGITSKISAVTSKMSELASKVKGFLPGSPVKTGPLRSWNRGGAGKRLVGLLVDGMDDSGPALRSASERMAASLRDPSVQLRASSEDAFAVAGSAAGVGLSRRDVVAIAEAVREGAYAGTSGRVEAQGMRRRAGGKA